MIGGEYTHAEFQSALASLYAEAVASSDVTPVDPPRAFLLGGQSGAGKTMLHGVLKPRFSFNVVVVNGDEYRARHPRFHELDRTHGAESVRYTAAWSGKMTEALIDALSRRRYNLIIEGTLRTAEVPLSTARLLREKGYGVSLAIMAVKPELSLLSCQIRYEQMKQAGTIPRATDPAYHNRIVHDIVGNLKVLEESGLFDGVELFARSKELLYPREGEKRSASEVLEDTLFGPWTPDELQHRAFLECYLQRMGRK